MPVAVWSDKRKRQYEHIRDGLVDRGRPGDLAEEIAARTVNKTRAQSGESRTASRTSINDLTPSRRGGMRRRSGGRTYRQLYEDAKRRHVRGRSSMSKRELERALER